MTWRAKCFLNKLFMTYKQAIIRYGRTILFGVLIRV